MRYEYCFGERWRQDVCNYLERHNVPYKILGGEYGIPQLIKFSIWNTRKDCDVLLEELHKIAHLKPRVFAHYSEKDLSNSRLLEIRLKSIKMCIENVDESFRYDCSYSYTADGFEFHKAHHEEQIGTIMIAKEPAVTTKTVFWGPDDGGTIIFADKKVVDLVQQENVNGVLFHNVLLKNKKPSARICQMLADHIIQHKDIVWGRGEEEQICSMCGKKQYTLPDAYQLHLHDDSVYREKDFFSTERIFGDGIAQPIYIISQRFYQLLKQNKYTAQVDFVPVVLE